MALYSPDPDAGRQLRRVAETNLLDTGILVAPVKVSGADEGYPYPVLKSQCPSSAPFHLPNGCYLVCKSNALD